MYKNPGHKDKIWRQLSWQAHKSFCKFNKVAFRSLGQEADLIPDIDKMNINAEQNPLIKGLPQEKIDEIMDVMSSFKKDFEEILNTRYGTETRKDQNEKKMGELKQKMAEKKKKFKNR